MGAVIEGLRTARGVARSLRIYYGDRQRNHAMDLLYRRVVQRGDLVFDIGAHVGDRIAAFRRLGARVVALEPQPALARTLRVLYACRRGVTIEPLAIGRREGAVDIRLNIDNPTISTASGEFVDAAKDAKGWEGQAWTKSVRVPMTTLDALIARHGRPSFIKIDVEGYEAEALSGLTQKVPALSFEFTTIQRDVALACIDHCLALGFGRFNAALGESHALAHETWLGAGDMIRWLIELPHDANSGDVYAITG